MGIFDILLSHTKLTLHNGRSLIFWNLIDNNYQYYFNLSYNNLQYNYFLILTIKIKKYGLIIMKLNELEKGQSATIRKISADQDLKNRLLSFGVLRGSNILVSECAPAKKTIKILVNNTMLALRLEEAKSIEVELCPTS